MAMFEAFTFKQKSVKSHNLLRKILKISDEDEADVFLSPLPMERRSQSTQTADIDDIELLVEVNDDAIIKAKHEQLCDYIEESEESDDVWQFVYLTGGENEDQIIEQDVKDIRNDEEIENEEVIQDELSLDLTDATECEYCSEQVPEPLVKSHLKQHMKVMPWILGSMDFFRCSRCLTAFPFIESLMEHVDAEDMCQQSTELDKIDTCTDYQYLANDPTIRLFSTCKNIDGNTFSCNLCVSDFVDLFSFRVHFEEEHLSNLDCHPEYLHIELAHTCGICDSSFKNLKDCLHHIYFHQAEYACMENDCDHVASSFSLLYSHLIGGHAPRSFECMHCTYQAKNGNELKEHQRSACPARNVKCEICGMNSFLEKLHRNCCSIIESNFYLSLGKSFYKKSTMTMHMRTHTNERRYPCSHCSKAFLQSNDLANHLRYER